MSLADTTNHGRLATLKALRDRLSADIDACRSACDVAALSKRLVDVLTQIDELTRATPPANGTGLSNFEQRLHERERKSARKTNG